MKNARIILAFLAVIAFIAVLGMTAIAALPDLDDLPLTLTGCVVAGEAKDSFMLTNVTIEGNPIVPERVRVDDDGNETTEITSERRKVKVDQNVWFGSIGSLKLEADVATYKFEVEDVKRLAGNCVNAEAAR